MITTRVQAYQLRVHLHMYKAVSEVCDFMDISKEAFFASMPKSLIDLLVDEYITTFTWNVDNVVLGSNAHRELVQVALHTAIPSITETSSRGNVLIHLQPAISKLVTIFDTVSPGHDVFAPLAELIESVDAEVAQCTKQFLNTFQPRGILFKNVGGYYVMIRSGEITGVGIRNLQGPETIITSHLNNAKAVIEFLTKINDLTTNDPVGFINDVLEKRDDHIRNAAETAVNEIYDTVMVTETGAGGQDESAVLIDLICDESTGSIDVSEIDLSLDITPIVYPQSPFDSEPVPRRQLTQADCDSFFASRR